MQIIRGLPSVFRKIDCALAIGNFDGVHTGHQELLREVVRSSRERGLVPAVLTFEPHPREFFHADAFYRVSTLRDKMQAILACGIERIYVLRFDQHFAQLSPEQFARDILAEGLACRWVTVGDNFLFGAQRRGTFETLRTLGQRFGFETVSTPLVFHHGERVCSTRLRQCLAQGDLFEVEQMLGHPYRLEGRVTHGAQLGRKLGFPTLNMFLWPASSCAIPALRGVFAVRVRGLNDYGTVYPAVASLGCKPTVTANARWSLETHVFDWSGDAYGRLISVEFAGKIRDEMKFDSLGALTARIEDDAKIARNLLGVQITA